MCQARYCCRQRCHTRLCILQRQMFQTQGIRKSRDYILSEPQALNSFGASHESKFLHSLKLNIYKFTYRIDLLVAVYNNHRVYMLGKDGCTYHSQRRHQKRPCKRYANNKSCPTDIFFSKRFFWFSCRKDCFTSLYIFSFYQGNNENYHQHRKKR